MDYPTDTQVTIQRDHVSFVQGRNRVEIYSDKTVWQEDAIQVGEYNSQTEKMEFYKTAIPCPEEQGPPLQLTQCRCGPFWKSVPGCWCLSNESVWLHLQADHISVYQDYEMDSPLFFEMIQPMQMAAAKDKIGKLLNLEVVQYDLSPDRLQARLQEFKEKRAQNYITFGFR
jgi:hypothetical protein